MVFEVLPSFEGQNGGLLYRLSASRQTGEKGFLRDPHPSKQPSSSACQSIILPARARLLTLWETVIPRSPVDFKLMTFCFLYFQHRRSANLSFPGKCFLGSFPLRIQSDFFFLFNFYLEIQQTQKAESITYRNAHTIPTCLCGIKLIGCQAPSEKSRNEAGYPLNCRGDICR